jgi:hypothetical protein
MLFEDTALMVADRTKRVKEARDEAKKEIDAYKKDKDDEFKKFESEVCLAPPTFLLAYCTLFWKYANTGLVAYQWKQEG